MYEKIVLISVLGMVGGR